MKAILVAIAAAIAVAGCSAGAAPDISSSGATDIRSLDKEGRAGHDSPSK
jgi:hypothetical protein